MCAWKGVKIRVMWPHEKCGGMTRFLCGDGGRGGLWFVVGAVRGRMGSRLSVVRGGQPPGSGRLVPRCALVGKKGRDARMGLVVPPNRLRAALAARCPSAADGARDGSGSRRERFETACGSGRAAARQRSTRSRCALVGKKGRDARMGLVVPPNRLRAALAARCPSAADGVRGGSVRGGLWFEAGSRWGVRWAVVRGGMGFEVGRSRDWGERGGAEGGGLPQ